GAERLEAVGRGDVGGAVQELRQVPGEVHVPGVAVDERRLFQAGGHGQVHRHGLQRRQVGRLTGQTVPRLEGANGQGYIRGAGLSEPSHLDGDALGQLSRKVFDVDAGPAVDVRRVLP